MATPNNHTIILCIPNSQFEEDLQKHVVSRFPQIYIYRGSEANVYERFQGAYARFSDALSFENTTNGVMRICADRPLLSKYMLSQLVHSNSQANELLFNHFNPNLMGPIGVGGESLSKELARSFFSTENRFWIDKEHVTYKLYKQLPNNCFFVPSYPKNLFQSSFDLSIDTPRELEMLNLIIDEFDLVPGGDISVEKYTEIERYLCGI